jgi:transposase
MQVQHKRCAGLDVHVESVVACVRIQSRGKPTTEVKTFATTTKGLGELAEWLTGAGVTHVAMEATGVYWKPVWHVLEPSFQLTLANAAHIKGVPGRKTDVNDATWIADLFAHGLIRASFVPPTPIQAVRSLIRTRKQVGRERTRHVQRIQKTLEDANVKFASVVSDITGVSGRAILRALIAGETDPEKLLALTSGRLQADRQELLDALQGHVGPHHRFLLKLHLDQVEALETAIEAIDTEVGSHLEPFRAKLAHLITMPGIGELAAQTILAEIGDDMSRFPTSGHLISWAGLCPRNDESAGKRRNTRLRHGTPWLKALLTQAAWCAVRCKQSYLRAQFLRLKSRCGPKKAIMAVAASMLTAAYFMLRDGTDYRDLGFDYYDRIDREKAAKRHLRRLKELGFHVEITRVA